MDDFERKWQLIRDELATQAAGTDRPRVVSTRTLFGIKSSVEVTMDAFAQEIQQEYTARRKAQDESSARSDPDTMVEPANAGLRVGRSEETP